MIDWLIDKNTTLSIDLLIDYILFSFNYFQVLFNTYWRIFTRLRVMQNIYVMYILKYAKCFKSGFIQNAGHCWIQYQNIKLNLDANNIFVFNIKYNWNIVESGVKHHNPNPLKHNTIHQAITPHPYNDHKCRLRDSINGGWRASRGVSTENTVYGKH